MPFPVDRQLIARAEQQIGAPLPEFLVRRLEKDNGGEFDAADDPWQLHPVFDDGDRKRIARTSNHLVRETMAAREWRGFPQDAVAIADNGTGDKLVLLRDGPRFGDSVYLWDHQSGTLELVDADFES